MKVWISRDNTDSVSDFVKIWDRKPERHYYKERSLWKWKGQVFFNPVFPRNPGWQIIDVRTFKENFGFTPRKGSCKEYELSLKKL